MNAAPIVEFLDADGSYVRAQPLDQARCRVLCSNVAPKGVVLLKVPDLGWKKAAEDLGGWTRLGPGDLVPLGAAPSKGADDRAQLEAIRDPGSPEEGEAEGPRALLGRLVRGTEVLTPRAVAQLLALPLRKKKRRLLRSILNRIRGDSRTEEELA